MLAKTMLASRSLWLTAIRMIPAMRVAGPVTGNVKSAANVLVSLASFNGSLRVAFMFTLAFTCTYWPAARLSAFIVELSLSTTVELSLLVKNCLR